MSTPTQLFNGTSIVSIQELLFNIAEYVVTNITTSNINTQQSVLQAIQQTLFNILDIVNAVQFFILSGQEYSLLLNVSGILQFLSSTDQAYINSRLASLNSFSKTVYPLNFTLTANVNNLTSGQPALQAYDLTSYLINFAGEVPPVALTTSNFIASANAMSTAWLDAINYLNVSATSFQLTAYNPVNRMSDCSQDDYNLLSNIILANSGLNLPQLWNSLVAVPSILRVLALLYNDPSSFTSQAINALKFAIFNLLFQTNGVLSSFNVPSTLPQPSTATLRAGESLMDFANRTTGNFEQWVTIATANGLIPPYVGTVPAPGIATPGQQLFLPPFSSNNLPLASYKQAYLGTDIDIGLPGTTMTSWSGDFPLISGVNNYIGALYRRILTPVGALIYHNTYGSKLSQEVGSIQTSNEAILMASYLKSALLQDPRTRTVNSIYAYPQNFGQIVLQSLVTPYGSDTPNALNLVIVPQNNG